MNYAWNVLFKPCKSIKNYSSWVMADENEFCKENPHIFERFKC